MKNILKFEYLFISLLVAGVYLSLGYEWYWLFILFLVFDISMLGYLVNNKVGAISYNIVHSTILPSLLLLICVMTGNKILLFIDLIWFFHIFVDRSLGYGLKHFEGFHHTHLGTLGKDKK